jgi:hypothetical protein
LSSSRTGRAACNPNWAATCRAAWSARGAASYPPEEASFQVVTARQAAQVEAARQEVATPRRELESA